MKTRKVTPADLIIISGWLKGHGQPHTISPDYLPPTGLIVEGIACLFLIKTDTKTAYFEGAISAPGCDKIERRQALKMLVEDLKKEATGYKIFMAYTAAIEGGNVLKDLGFISQGTVTAYGSFI